MNGSFKKCIIEGCNRRLMKKSAHEKCEFHRKVPKPPRRKRGPVLNLTYTHQWKPED